MLLRHLATNKIKAQEYHALISIASRQIISSTIILLRMAFITNELIAAIDFLRKYLLALYSNVSLQSDFSIESKYLHFYAFFYMRSFFHLQFSHSFPNNYNRYITSYRTSWSVQRTIIVISTANTHETFEHCACELKTCKQARISLEIRSAKTVPPCERAPQISSTEYQY